MYSAFCEGEASYSQGSRSLLEIEEALQVSLWLASPSKAELRCSFPTPPQPVHDPFNCPVSVTMSGEHDPEGMASLTLRTSQWPLGNQHEFLCSRQEAKS